MSLSVTVTKVPSSIVKSGWIASLALSDHQPDSAVAVSGFGSPVLSLDLVWLSKVLIACVLLVQSAVHCQCEPVAPTRLLVPISAVYSSSVLLNLCHGSFPAVFIVLAVPAVFSE